MQSDQAAIPGVILAGGAGRRIGGDKAHVLLMKRPLWARVAERLQPQVSALAVNGTGTFGNLPVIADAQPGMGPLSGILRAMDWGAELGAARVLTVAVDTPFLPVDLAARLAGADGPIAMARTPDGLHGTVALWDVAQAGALRAALAIGTRKVTEWAGEVGITPVDFASGTPPFFYNINTPEDLARAEAWLA